MDSLGNAETAKALYAAYVAKDREAAERLIAENFHFSSPLDNRIDRTAYFAICWPVSEAVEAFDIIHVFEAGSHVAVTYEGRWKDGRRFRNTEVLTMKDGKVIEADVYFGWSVPHEASPGCHKGPA